ncbi:MAG: GAF domain-containing protein [bacterium]|nr:GAF domain-containing protein [bacterium]
MDRRHFSPYLQRLALRGCFAVVVLVWKLLAQPGKFALEVQVLGFLFCLYAVTVFVWEKWRRGLRREPGLFTYMDILFAGAFIGMSGGAENEFYLLLYFIVAIRAPYFSWLQTVMIPGVSSVAYLAAVGQAGRDTHWFDLMVRIGLLWFLAVLLKFIGLKTMREKERARRLTEELSSTHNEVRRYTAALEKANADKERRLAEITLLHQFVMEVRGSVEYDSVYKAILSHAGQVCEAPWVFLVHRSSPEKPGIVVRSKGDPPEVLKDAVWEFGIDPGCGSDGARVTDTVEELGEVDLRYFVRCYEDRTSVSLVLAFPASEAFLLDEQVEVLSALMDTVEMELELLRLHRDLGRSNRKLSESNRHLTRLHELQQELSSAFLAEGDISAVIHRAQDIMAKELFELDRLNLFLPGEDGTMLQCRTSVGIGYYPLGEIAVPVDERGGAISLAFREGRTIFYNGKGTVPDEFRLAEPYSRIPAIRSRIFVIVPLIDHRGVVLGVIGADRKYTRQPIPEETVAMLEFFARHVAMVLSIQELTKGRGNG